MDIDDFGEIRVSSRNEDDSTYNRFRESSRYSNYHDINFITDFAWWLKLLITFSAIIGTLAGYEITETTFGTITGLFWGLWIIFVFLIIVGDFFEDIFAMCLTFLVSFWVGFTTLLAVWEGINLGLIAGFGAMIATLIGLKVSESEERY